ncbi:hypothetical protein GWI33_020018 [Rhynchophorus ferrugineus]|uniref:Uncharacterized protein n=1 Tax=Rhynchophorus ferrugineus TaxID=354439 RepID=A0A834M3R7_RHYFE|nr:hypothetical protein GWI33_020018 [Rhynchophorus ferrugineus]
MSPPLQYRNPGPRILSRKRLFEIAKTPLKTAEEPTNKKICGPLRTLGKWTCYDHNEDSDSTDSDSASYDADNDLTPDSSPIKKQFPRNAYKNTEINKILGENQRKLYTESITKLDLMDTDGT